MKRVVKVSLLVCLVVLLLGSAVSAKLLEEWVGSDSQMNAYLASGCECIDLEMWCLKNGYVLSPGFTLETQTEVIVNGSKGENDLGTLDISNDFDNVNVRYLENLDPASLGVMIEIEGSIIPVYDQMSLDELNEEVRYNIAPYLSFSEEYCKYMVTLIVYDLGAFLDFTQVQ